MDTDKKVDVGKNVRRKDERGCKDLGDEKWDKIGTSKLRKMEQREKLQKIDNYLDDIMGMATDIGNEMKVQSKMINQVQDEMQDLDSKFVDKNTKMKRIMRK